MIPTNQVAASPRGAAARAREEQALELRRAGCSYREIGQHFGVNPGMAHKLVRRAMDRQLTRVADLADEVLTIELDRLDRLLRGIWTQATAGHLGAIDRALKISERRARLLGIEAPQKVATTRADGEDLEPTATGIFVVPAQAESVDAWLAQVAQHRQTKPPAE